LYLSAAQQTAAIGDSVTVVVRVDSPDQGFNAAQATIQFPISILEAASVNRDSSALNFWLEEPAFSNTAGTISFIGGSTSGFAGKSVEIARIVFRVKGSGTADLVFSDGAVTASDGSGTNILSTLQGVKIVSSAAQRPGEAVVAPPAQIVRPAAPAAKLPVMPGAAVTLYPKSEAWYNVSAPFFVNWALPADVSDVLAIVNKIPEFTSTKSEGLFERAQFPALDDGVTYAHVRFRNNIGWGPVAHYRIAVDTVPPAGLEVSVIEGTPTDTPNPRISYRAADALSGVVRYEIRIGDAEPIVTKDTAVTLPLQTPGAKNVLVRAVDGAGNSTERLLELEILPIETPVISSLPDDVFVGEGALTVVGISVPHATVLLSVMDRSGLMVHSASVTADEAGNWSAVIDEPLRKGVHYVEAVAKDARGALSLPAQSELFTVHERPLLTLFGFDITQTWFFVGLILIVLGGFAAGWVSYRFWKVQVGHRVVIAQRDVVTVANLVKKDLDKMLESYADRTITGREVSEIEFLVKKAKANVEKMEKYLVENIGDIPK
ncbi:hypothetical protein HY479_03440, partial [Candidatus Uhrbacteria bacterium]|nr:hypothetical protein [Candidatus Uhrbacteria bacterium]